MAQKKVKQVAQKAKMPTSKAARMHGIFPKAKKNPSLKLKLGAKGAKGSKGKARKAGKLSAKLGPALSGKSKKGTPVIPGASLPMEPI